MFEVAEPLAGVVGAEFSGDGLDGVRQETLGVGGDGPVGTGRESGLVLGGADDGAECLVALPGREGVVLEEGFDELLAAVGLDFGEPGGGQRFTDGSPVGSVGGRVGGSQDVVECGQLAGIGRGSDPVAAVVGVEAGPDGGAALLRGSCSGEELGGDQGAKQFVVGGAYRKAGFGDAPYILRLVGKQDLHGVVIEGELGVGVGQHVGECGDVEVDDRLTDAVLDVRSVEARCVGDNTVRPAAITVSCLPEQTDPAGEGRLRLYVDVLSGVAVQHALRSFADTAVAHLDSFASTFRDLQSRARNGYTQ